MNSLDEAVRSLSADPYRPELYDRLIHVGRRHGLEVNEIIEAASQANLDIRGLGNLVWAFRRASYPFHNFRPHLLDYFHKTILNNKFAKELKKKKVIKEIDSNFNPSKVLLDEAKKLGVDIK